MIFTAPSSSPTSTDTLAVIGSGSWATALVKILTDHGNHVDWYVRKEADISHIKTYLQNPNYLKGVKFKPDSITPSRDLNTVISKNKWIILALPSAFLEATLEQLKVSLDNKIIVSGVKGLLPKTKSLVGDYVKDYFNVPPAQFVVISGPCHAEEIAINHLSFLTLGCSDIKTTTALKSKMSTPYLSISISKDVVGIELAAILKNMYALVAGIATGLAYGDNFHSVLLSNSIEEMKAFLNQRNPTKRNLNSSVYLGDLIVTAYSEHSRNRRLGELIGKGHTVEKALEKINMIAEGYYASKNFAVLKAECSVETPIMDSLYEILFKGKSAAKTMQQLVQKLH